MSEEILDFEDFLERVQGDTELLMELLDIFVNDFQEKRQALGEAFKNNDCQGVEHIAHFLKGSCGNISAEALRKIFFELEQMGRSQKLENRDYYLDAIDQQFEKLAVRIGEIRRKYP